MKAMGMGYRLVIFPSGRFSEHLRLLVPIIRKTSKLYRPLNVVEVIRVYCQYIFMSLVFSSLFQSSLLVPSSFFLPVLTTANPV